MRLFQNFSFWNSFFGFDGKTGLLTGFSKSLFHRTGGSHRARLAHSQLVLEQAQIVKIPLNSPEFLRKTNRKGEIEPSVRGAQRMYEAMRYSFLLRLGG
jgi:hypothetical protein